MAYNSEQLPWGQQGFKVRAVSFFKKNKESLDARMRYFFFEKSVVVNWLMDASHDARQRAWVVSWRPMARTRGLSIRMASYAQRGGDLLRIGCEFVLVRNEDFSCWGLQSVPAQGCDCDKGLAAILRARIERRTSVYNVDCLWSTSDRTRQRTVILSSVTMFEVQLFSSKYCVGSLFRHEVFDKIKKNRGRSHYTLKKSKSRD